MNPANPIKTELPCSLCGGPLTAFPDDGVNVNKGVTLRCDNNPCPCHENPFGHGDNLKEAHEILKQKYRKS